MMQDTASELRSSVEKRPHGFILRQCASGQNLLEHAISFPNGVR